MTGLVEQPLSGSASLTGSAELETRDGRSCLVLRGIVDVTLTEQLAAAVTLAAGGAGPVDVDAAEVTELDTAAAASLAWLAVSCAGPVHLVSASAAVRDVLGSTGVAELLDR